MTTSIGEPVFEQDPFYLQEMIQDRIISRIKNHHRITIHSINTINHLYLQSHLVGAERTEIKVMTDKKNFTQLYQSTIYIPYILHNYQYLQMMTLFCRRVVFQLKNSAAQQSVNYHHYRLQIKNALFPVNIILQLMKQLLLICSLLLTTIYSQGITCSSGMSPVDLIQTGAITAIVPALIDNNRAHSFVVPINVYSVPSTGFQITTSISQYLIAQNKTQPGYDFSVVGMPLDGISAQIVLFINNDLTWTRILVSYIITSRKDLFLGGFPILGHQFSSASNKTYTYKYVIPNWINPAAPAISLAQLSGFRTATPQITMLKINSASIDAFNGILIVNITVDITAPLQLIVFSYVWWIQSNSIKFSAFSPQAGSNAAYQFVGLGSLSSQGFIYNGLGFAGSGLVGSVPCTGINCPSGCISVTDCITKNGVLANSTCFICGSNQIYQNMSCQAAVTCGTNMKPLGTTCICQDGFFYVNSTFCIKCPTNAYWSGSKCMCNFGYYAPDQTICLVCPKGSTYNQLTLKCDCPTGFYWNLGGCITCSINQVWDATKNQCICANGYTLSNNSVCVPTCPSNSTMTSNGCVCNFGFVNVSNSCVPCPSNSAFVVALNTCYCYTGSYMVNGSCVPCGPNSSPDSSQSQCICNDGYYNMGGTCQACPDNSSWNGTDCDCESGYSTVNGSCAPTCGSNEIYNGLACICVDTFVRFGNVCSCPLNSMLSNGKCMCNLGFTMINGFCNFINPPTNTTNSSKTSNTTSNSTKNSTSNSTSNSTKNSTSNSTKNSTSNSTKNATSNSTKCPDKSAWNGTQCICIPNLYMIKGSCQPCPQNSTYDAKSLQCICKQGYYGDFSGCFNCDQSCKTCWNGQSSGCISCNAKYKLLKGSCVCRNPKTDKDGKEIC